MACEEQEQAAREGRDISPREFEEHALSDCKRVIGVMSGKGGVGKSLVTGILACELQRAGMSVGILDADITGPSIPRMFGLADAGVEGFGDLYLPRISEGGIKVMSTNLLLPHEDDPVLWRGPMLAGAIRQFWSQTSWGPLDCMLIDMPPGTGDVALTVFQSLPVDGVIVVTSPQDLVSMIVGKAVHMCERMEIDVLGLVENMAYVRCPDCGREIEVFGTSHLDEACERYGLASLGRLPLDPRFASMCDTGTLEAGLEAGLLPSAVDVIRAIEPHSSEK
ncbi:MAG: Mrp/NBP35 family ATP-binding protein [Atopobiaceae bacterium]|nr:Mrp/NBP35 family ATP-binding protein [Atopobiaceae bacterium]